MALYSVRLRRALPLGSSLLHHHFHSPKIVSPIYSIAPAPSAALNPQNPRASQLCELQSFRLFRSSPVSLSSRRNRFDEEMEITENTILFEGCDYNHWLITVDFPKDAPAADKISTYENIAAQVFGSMEEAKKKIYACSTTVYDGFQVLCSEEISEKFKDVPGVVFVLPDSYIDPVNKQYGGDKYINGEIIHMPPPISYMKRDSRSRPQRNENRGPMPAYENRGQMHGEARNFGPPQNPRQQNFGPPQSHPHQQNFGPPQSHPHQQNFGPPQSQPHQQNFGPPQSQPHQQNFGPPQSHPHQQNFGPPQSHPHQQNFGPPQSHPHQQNFGPPHQQNFGPPHQQNHGPPHQQNFGPQRQENFGPPQNPPYQQNFGSPQNPPRNSSFQQNFNPPQNHPFQQNFSPPQSHPQQNFSSPQSHSEQNFSATQNHSFQQNSNPPQSPSGQNFGPQRDPASQQNYPLPQSAPPLENYGVQEKFSPQQNASSPGIPSQQSYGPPGGIGHRDSTASGVWDHHEAGRRDFQQQDQTVYTSAGNK